MATLVGTSMLFLESSSYQGPWYFPHKFKTHLGMPAIHDKTGTT